MKQDVNKIIDNLSADWAQDLGNSKRKLAIAVEENRLLKEKVEELEAELAEAKKASENKTKEEDE